MRSKTFLLILGDFLILWTSLVATLFSRYHGDTFVTFDEILQIHIMPFALVFTAWLLMFGAFGLYDLRSFNLTTLRNSRRFLIKMAESMFLNLIIAIIIFYLNPKFEIEPRRNLMLIASASFVLIFGWRVLANIFISKSKPLNVIFFGINPEVSRLSDWLLKNPQFGMRPVAFISSKEDDALSLMPLPVFSQNQNLENIAQNTACDIVVVTREIKENKTLTRALFQLIPLGVGVIDFAAFHEMLTGKIPLSLIGEMWFLENLVGIRKEVYEYSKRILDMILASIAGIILLIILPATALAIKLNSKGPVFFRQKRVGRNGKDFELIKFRSMLQKSEEIGGYKENGNDARHTAIGRILRRTYIDELPQIINIFRGEMSFIGPRPERPEYVRELKEKVQFYDMRFLVHPGITGWAQINMEDDASVEDAPEKMQYDLYYIKNRSFVLDLLVALRTLFIILRRPGR